MSEQQGQRQFWDHEASTASFSHPLDPGWLKRIVDPESRILDYGCGYGRTIEALRTMGFRNVTGLDSSLGMLDRARSNLPEVPLVFSDGVPSPLPDASFDLIILFAVLTSVPEDDRQRALIGDAFRLVRPGGHLYVSDLLLQTDPRRVTRYETARPAGSPYGTFEIDGGRAVMRHHSLEWFDDLFSDFCVAAKKTLPVATMRGRMADAVQFLLERAA